MSPQSPQANSCGSVWSERVFFCHENKHPCCLDLFVFSQRPAAPCSRGCRQRLFHCEPPPHTLFASVSITYEGPAALPSAIAFNQSHSLIYASCCPWHRCNTSPIYTQSPHLPSALSWLRPPPRSSWERWPQGSTVGSKIVLSRGSGMKGMLGWGKKSLKWVFVQVSWVLWELGISGRWLRDLGPLGERRVGAALE